jgi:hypothetical protein
MNWGALLESIKTLTPKITLPICIASIILLFAPPSIVSRFGLDHFNSENRGWIALTFLVSASLLASQAVFKYAPSGIHFARREMNMRRRARLLSRFEKRIIRDYIDNDTRTRYYSVNDAIVSRLVRAGFLERATSVSTYEVEFGFSMTDWAYKPAESAE